MVNKLESLKQKAKKKPIYNMPKNELNNYINYVIKKYDDTSNIHYKYRVRSFKEVYDDLVDIDFGASSEGIITGEEYEEWVRERFRNLTEDEELAYIKCLDNISEPTGVKLL